MKIEASRLIITDFQSDMAKAVHLGSLDDDTRRFLPDEVFEPEAIAADVIADLMECYGGTEGPFVHPILVDGVYAGYVQLIPIEEGWEIGYHVVKDMTGQGYATEAVQAFLPVIMKQLSIPKMLGVCLADNHASRRVMEKVGFKKQYEGDGDYQGQICPICKYQYE